MSLAAMHWARQSLKTLPSEVRAPCRLALLLLADYAAEDHVSWTSVGTMALEMGCSKRSVQRAIDVLEEHGLLAVESRLAPNGRQQSNRYRLAVGLGCQSVTPSTSDQPAASGEGDNLTPPEGDKLTGEGDSGDRGRVSPVSPLDTTTRTLTPSHSDARAASSTPDWFGESLTDDGQPLDDPADPSPPLADHRQRQQPMTLDWEPEPETWRRACWERGLAPDADVHQPLLDFREHFAALPGRTATHSDWTRRFARWVHENLRRLAPATGGHRDASRHAGSAQPADHADQRRRVREQLANPEDLSWASGLWDDPAAWAEPGAPGGDEAAGGPGVHPADGVVPEDLGERVPERPGAESGTPRAGAGAGPLAGAADPCGDRAGNERAEAGGEYLAADDPGADGDAGAHPGGFRYAAAR